MADAIEQRDFFISFNGADLAYAEAIDAALRAAGFTTYYHPNDIGPGGNIPLWMDNALMNSRQMLALYSPEYVADGAVYSESERYARFWQDSRGAEFKLIPVELKTSRITPLMSVYKRIDAKGKTPAQAGATVVSALKKPEETKQREVLHSAEPLPKIFNVLYRHNPNFTGRFEAMESLQKSLRDGNAAITALAGMGGVGKTTLAAEYCHRFGGRYGGVWWVRAEQESVMLSDLVALGARLGIAASGNIENDAHATVQELGSRTEPWLMIYDNAPNPDAVGKWLPAGAVRCVITSRFSGFDGIASVTKLDQWSDEVTADYLLARTGRDDKAGALRLAHTLGGLPLAAEQAAVFLRDRKGISFDDYAADITELIKRPRPKGATGDYPDTVYAAFVKSLEMLGTTGDGQTALDLLRVCAFLSPDGVDLALLLADKKSEFLPASFAKILTNKSVREDALAALISMSLLRQENGSDGPILIFHRLLLEVVRDWMGAEDRGTWGEAALQLVGSVFPFDADDDPSQWPLCARLIIHVALLDKYAPRAGAAGKALGFLLNQSGIYLAARGDRLGALAIMQKCVELMRQARPDSPLDIAITINNLATRYADLDQLDDAENAFKEVLQIADASFVEDDPNMAFWISNLAEVYRRRKWFAKAEALYLRASKILKAARGKASGEFGISLSNLGALYSDWANEPTQTARRAQEKKYKTQALAVTRAARGVRHPSTAIQYNNISVMKSKMQDWAGAALAAERALAIVLSLDLSEHPNTRRIAGMLSYTRQRSERPEKGPRNISDLLPVIAQIEAEHRAWVAEDPANRHFGPPSPFKFEK